MNPNPHGHRQHTQLRLSPEDIQLIYTLYLSYMQMHYADISSEPNAAPEIG